MKSVFTSYSNSIEPQAKAIENSPYLAIMAKFRYIVAFWGANHGMFKHSQTQACLARQAGLTVIELMLSIAIIGSLLLVGARYFKSVKSEQQITKAATMVRDIISAANSWGTGNPNFEKISMDTLIAVNLLPASYTENPWGGAIMVGPTSDFYHINIKFTQTPAGACNALTAQFPEYSISCESK